MVQKQAKQVFGLGVACRLIRYRTDQPDIRHAPRWAPCAAVRMSRYRFCCLLLSWSLS